MNLLAPPNHSNFPSIRRSSILDAQSKQMDKILVSTGPTLLVNRDQNIPTIDCTFPSTSAIQETSDSADHSRNEEATTNKTNKQTYNDHDNLSGNQLEELPEYKNLKVCSQS